MVRKKMEGPGNSLSSQSVSALKLDLEQTSEEFSGLPSEKKADQEDGIIC